MGQDHGGNQCGEWPASRNIFAHRTLLSSKNTKGSHKQVWPILSPQAPSREHPGPPPSFEIYTWYCPCLLNQEPPSMRSSAWHLVNVSWVEGWDGRGSADEKREGCPLRIWRTVVFKALWSPNWGRTANIRHHWAFSTLHSQQFPYHLPVVWSMVAVNKLLSVILWRGEARDHQLHYEIPELWPKLLMKFQAGGIWEGGSKVVSPEVFVVRDCSGHYGDSTERVLDGGKVGSHFIVIMVMIWGFTREGCNTKHFIYITSFNPYSHLTRQYFYLHFIEEQTGVQRGKYSYSRSHGWSYSKPVLWSQRKVNFNKQTPPE